MEVQEMTFNYIALPQPIIYMDTKILLFVVSEFVVGVRDGLDECEICRPDILSQSVPGFWYICNVTDQVSKKNKYISWF